MVSVFNHDAVRRQLLGSQLLADGANAEQTALAQQAARVWLTLLGAMLTLGLLCLTLALMLMPVDQLDLLITFVTGGRS